MMKLLLITLLFFVSSSLATYDTYFFTDTISSALAADIYFAETQTASPLPVVILLHDSNVHRDFYTVYSTDLASGGYLVIVPQATSVTADTAFTGVPAVTSVAAAIAFLTNENVEVGGPLEGLVDIKNVAIVGHGYGGLAGWVSVAANGASVAKDVMGVISSESDFVPVNNVKIVLSWGSDAVDRNTETVVDIDTNGVPLALFSGTLDEKSPLGFVAATYKKFKAPKARVVFDGLNHNAILDSPNLDPTEREQVIDTDLTYYSDVILSAWLKGNEDGKKTIYVDRTVPDEELHVTISEASLTDQPVVVVAPTSAKRNL